MTIDLGRFSARIRPIDIFGIEMKPYILGKYPQASTGLFMQNSDIHFLIKNMEEGREDYIKFWLIIVNIIKKSDMFKEWAL